jgi:hypothetical protein
MRQVGYDKGDRAKRLGKKTRQMSQTSEMRQDRMTIWARKEGRQDK